MSFPKDIQKPPGHNPEQHAPGALLGQQAGLDDLLTRSICEMEEKPEREKPAESALTDQALTDFPIPANISVAGLKVLLISLWIMHSSSSFSALLTSVCLGLLQRLPVLSESTKQVLSLCFSPASEHESNSIPIQQNT